jgi:murein DD-endopeptidase MepM/ murein hydrolase activator NlpD
MSTIHRSSGFKRFVSGKGFYALLAVCLLVVGGVAFAVFADSLGQEENPNITTPTTGEQNVVEPVTNVPDTRTTATTVRTTVTTTPTTVATKPSAPLFVLPGSNEVAKGFSGNTPVYSETMGDWRCHNGADFTGNEGMTVKAVSEGTVKSVTDDAAMGGCIVIDHGFGVESRYCGVTPSVKQGQAVKVGAEIGTLSGVPCESADGCHLHLEIMVSGAYVDPVKTIDAQVKYKKSE